MTAEVGGARTAVVNVQQEQAGDGHEGDIWTAQADRYDRASHRIWQRFLDANLVDSADHVLDVGCGTGRATRDVARTAHAGHVTGIDLSTRMLDLARKRSTDEHLENLTFVRGDAQVHRFEPERLDVVMSSFGAMFFDGPVAAFANIGVGLRSKGTLALQTWRTLPENGWLMSIRDALAVGRVLPLLPPDSPTPFALADPDRVLLLESETGDGVLLPSAAWLITARKG